MKDKVVFETNVPVEACLTNAEGKEIGGRRREQVMYDLADGRLMFVPPSIRDQIRKLEVKPGERFQVCKREVDYLRQLDPRAPARENYGYNAITYGDLVKEGIIDPAKVARIALQNASSIAGLMLTTEALIAEIPEKEKAPAGPHAGEMGGGMY